MRDFPVFTTEFGVASLVLKEVPYRQEAYIVIQSALQPEELLQECISFCRMVGAERIYARGHEITQKYKLHCAVCEMRGQIEPDEEKIAHLWPVTEENVGQWRAIYNERMRTVDNAGTMEKRDEKKILSSGGAYFIHNFGELLGIGWLEEEMLLAVASVRSGAGERVMHTLLSLVEGSVTLEVASTNVRAIGLYEKLGFITTREVSRWYRVL